MPNIFLMHPDEIIEFPHYEFVCDVCGTIYYIPLVRMRPRMFYKIDQGLLLRAFDILDPLQQCCDHSPGNVHFLFHKPSQDEVTLEQIIELQNSHLESDNLVAKLPGYHRQISPPQL